MSPWLWMAVTSIPPCLRARATGLTSLSISTKSPVIAALPSASDWKFRTVVTPIAGSKGCPISVIDSALDAVVTAAGGTIIGFNPAAERLFGHTSEEAVGQSVALIVPPSLREPLAHVFNGENDEVLDRRIQVHALRADGSLFPVELAITRTKEKPPTFTGFFRDMRRQRAAE